MDYGKIRKVHSIWILMKSSKEEQNSITEYALEERLLTGGFRSEKKDYDLMALVILTLGDADKANQEILQLLDTVFTSEYRAIKHEIER